MRSKIKAVLTKLEKRSNLEKSRKVFTTSDQRMLAITKETGEFFHTLLVGIRAKRVLELGTSVGYSTLWFADALLENHENPRIITIEKNPFKISMSLQNFERAGVSRFIQIRHGMILDVLRKMPKKPVFDFVLIDADKENAKEYFDHVLPMLKVGGIVATDNMLFPEKYRKIMCKYSKHIAKKPNVCSATIPLGNGEEITVKIR
jgi:predicted O-methyltransferase YrrM